MVKERKEITISFKSSEYLTRVFERSALKDVQPLLDYYDSIVIAEHDVLKVDAEVGLEEKERKLEVICDSDIIGELPKLINFSIMQGKIAEEYRPFVELMIKFHIKYLKEYLERLGSMKPEVLAVILHKQLDDYAKFMEYFFRAFIPSVYKNLVLKSLNEREIEALRSIKGMLDPFKLNFEDYNSQELCIILVDNLWRERLGWTVPEEFYRRVGAVEDVKMLFNEFSEALESKNASKIREIAERLTNVTLRIFGINGRGFTSHHYIT